MAKNRALLPLLILVPLALALTWFLYRDNESTTRPADKDKPSYANIDSLFQWRFDSKLSDDNLMARFGEQDIQPGELVGHNAAETELIERNQKLALFVAYSWALGERAKNKKPVKLLVSFPEPTEGLNTFLDSLGIKPDSQIIPEFSSPASSAITIKVGSKTYTENSFALGSLEFAKNRLKILKLRITRLEDIIVKKTLIAEAEKLNLNLNEFIEKKIFSPQDITNKDIEDYAAQNNIPQHSLNDQVRKRLRSVIKGRTQEKKLKKYVAQLLKTTPIDVVYPPLSVKVYHIATPDRLPHYGTGTLPVTLISNPICLACRKMEPELLKLAVKYKSKIKFSYLFHSRAGDVRVGLVAEASYCIRDQGEELFWDFLQRAYAENFDGQEKKIIQLVRDMGLDEEGFRACYLSRKYKDELKEHGDLIKYFGTVKYPTILVGDHFFETPFHLELVEQKVRQLSH